MAEPTSTEPTTEKPETNRRAPTRPEDDRLIQEIQALGDLALIVENQLRNQGLNVEFRVAIFEQLVSVASARRLMGEVWNRSSIDLEKALERFQVHPQAR